MNADAATRRCGDTASPDSVSMPTSFAGVLVVDKPEGITSHDVVARVRKLFGTKRVGHAGTLDPMATGVLVLALGRATRVVEYLATSRKRYTAGVVFGVTTDTEDATGHVVSRTDADNLTESEVEAALRRFRGRIEQTPPMVSAVHHGGQRLYDLARQGIEVERKPRPVEIYSLELLSFRRGAQPEAYIDVECSAGTYIRTLAADIGEGLGCGAMMSSLRRTWSGGFGLDRALTLEELGERKEQGTLGETLHSIREALPDWPHVPLTEDQVRRIANGQSVDAPSGLAADRPVLLLDPAGAAVAVAQGKEGLLAPVKVFVGPPTSP